MYLKAAGAYPARSRQEGAPLFDKINQHRGALRGIPGSACPQPEPNATELPSNAPGRPKLIEPQATKPSPTPTRAEEDIDTTPGYGPTGDSGHRAFAHADMHRGTHRHDAGSWTCRPPRLRPRRHAEHLAGLKIVRLRALAHRRAPKRTTHVAGLQTSTHQQRVSNVQRAYEETVCF